MLRIIQLECFEILKEISLERGHEIYILYCTLSQLILLSIFLVFGVSTNETWSYLLRVNSIWVLEASLEVQLGAISSSSIHASTSIGIIIL